MLRHLHLKESQLPPSPISTSHFIPDTLTQQNSKFFHLGSFSSAVLLMWASILKLLDCRVAARRAQSDISWFSPGRITIW
ncbi:hypothetical protein EYF80_021335 [Liparis tanakae]|uniref:Uncharacterized protein n=1 Tax=Liparis tanakae TaxID=230148 RepID=A0A4Z2HTU5_9TELE|nr:hypothetical protein EYF80_021335 [Liparis tanakae]